MEGFFTQARAPLHEEISAKREIKWLEKARVVSTNQLLLAPKVDPVVFKVVSNTLHNDLWLTL